MSEESGKLEFTGSMPEGEVTFAKPLEWNFVICGEDSIPLVTIHQNGTLEYGPNYTPDETARVFWEALRVLPKSLNDIREKVELLELDFARLDSKYGKDWTEWMDVRETIRELRTIVVK